MKNSICAAFVSAWLMATPSLWAQDNANFKVVPRDKVFDVGTVPQEKPAILAVPSRVRTKYRLHIWAHYTRTVALDADGKIPLYGTLRINDKVRWSIPVEAANSFRHTVKEQIEISEDTAHLQDGSLDIVVVTSRPLAEIKLSLSRPLFDNSTSPPRPISGRGEPQGLFAETINLKNLVGQTHKISPIASLPIQAFVKVESLGAAAPPVSAQGSYTVTARLRVTKANDGPLDNQVELGGSLEINNQSFAVPNVSAKAGDEIALGSREVTLNKTTPKMLLIASIFDKNGANTQPMLSLKTPLDLSRIVDKNGNCVIPGRGKDVSADLLLHISTDKNVAYNKRAAAKQNGPDESGPFIGKL